MEMFGKRCFFGSVAIVLLLLVAQPAMAMDWQLESFGQLGAKYPSMAIDSPGTIHVSYTATQSGSGNGELRYAYRDGSGWHDSVVDTGAGVNVGQSAIALYIDNRPVIAYIDQSIGSQFPKLKFAQQNAGGGWAVRTLTGAGGTLGNYWIGGRPAILVLPGSDILIAFWDIGHSDLDYCELDYDGGALVSPTKFDLLDDDVGTQWNEDPAPSLVLDHLFATPNAGILYSRIQGGSVEQVYRNRDPDGWWYWPESDFSANSIPAKHGSIASRSVPYLGANGMYGHRFWSAAGEDGSLLYGLDTVGSERGSYTVTADADGGAALHASTTSIALDQYNMSCIAYTDPTTNKLMYAWNDGFWHSTVVDSLVAEDSWGRQPPILAFDPSGNPVICYTDSTQDAFRIRLAGGSNAIPAIPAKKSYEQYLTLVGNQRHAGQCSWFSYLHAMEIEKEMEIPYTPDFSFGFAHYIWTSTQMWYKYGISDPRLPHVPRQSDGDPGVYHDHDAMELFGYARETDYPSNFDLFNPTNAYDPDERLELQDPPTTPPTSVFDAAAHYRIANHSDTFRRPTAKMAERLLAVNGPLVLYQYYFGHVVCLIGYDRDRQELYLVDSDHYEGQSPGVKTITYDQFDSVMLSDNYDANRIVDGIHYYRAHTYVQAVRNRPTGLADPYTARIHVTHSDARRFLEVQIGAVGQAPLTVWNQSNRYTGAWEDDLQTLEIDVALPEYATNHWPPSDANPWYVKVVDHDPIPGAQVTLNEITFVKRSRNIFSGRYLVDTYQPTQPVTVPCTIPSQGNATIYVPGDPVITGINPARAAQGTSNVSFTISGSHFQTGAQVTLSRRTTAPPPFDKVTIEASYEQVQGAAGQQTITGTFDLTTAPAGLYNITVTNPSGLSDTYLDGFTVTGPALSVSSITPNTGGQGTTVAITDLAGGGFLDGATVTLRSFGLHDIQATDVVVASSSKITCKFTIPLTTATGPWNVTVTNPGGSSATLTNGFTIARPALSVTSITPNSGGQRTTVSITNLAGTGFQNGATVKLRRQIPDSLDWWEIAATNVTAVLPTKITCQFVIPRFLSNTDLGDWNVVVTNPNTDSATLFRGFTIVRPVLSVSSIAPNAGLQGETVAITNLAGGGFQNGATVMLQAIGHEDIPGMSVATVSPTQLTCQFAIPATAAVGYWNVTVRNANGDTATLMNAFHITKPVLSVSSIVPSTGVQGATVAITNLAGGGFQNGATVRFTRTGSADIAATGVTVVSASKITCSVALPATASTGTWNVLVTNPNGDSVTLSNGFTVTGLPPTVSAIAPSSGGRGTTVSITNLSGDRFQNGATVKLTRTGSADIVATGVSVASATKITCTVALPLSAAMGAWNVVVTNPGGQSGTLNNGFTVLAPPPTVTAIAPNTGAQGATVSTTITGTGFTAPATVRLMMIESLFPPRIHMVQATGVVVTSPTRITCTFALPATAPIGTWSVSVTNPDTQVGSLMGFTVTVPVTTTETLTPTGTVTPGPTVTRFPGGSGNPTDPDGNGKYEDVNGNLRKDFADVVLYFNQMAWIPAHEPLSAFDYNGNGRIDFADVVWLFNHL